ncbi:uncharacterized protein LOC125570209 [Nematostella vectensis]|uniref:uncharacterized protein LOC125570209 n=1 Tax=Nematostella vectensis TaxID=45351 RepID=UPI002076F961|nr:uncharacterized protein LOC125570209 [Nematostella vectensis]
MDTLVIQHLRQKEEEREAVLKKALGKELILRIPEEEALAMKADLRLPWFALGKHYPVFNSRDKNVILFAFGDYEYICRMLGIFGASGKKSQGADNICPISLFKVENKCILLTPYTFFMFSQICVPVLHISLGLFFKFYDHIDC